MKYDRFTVQSRDRVASGWLVYGVDVRGVVVRLLRDKFLFLLRNVQIASVTYPTSLSVNNGRFLQYSADFNL